MIRKLNLKISPIGFILFVSVMVFIVFEIVNQNVPLVFLGAFFIVLGLLEDATSDFERRKITTTAFIRIKNIEYKDNKNE